MTAHQTDPPEERPPIDAPTVRRLMRQVKHGSEEADAFVWEYIDEQLPRFVRTLQRVPVGGPDRRLLDAGGLVNLVPCYLELLAYRNVTVTSRTEDSAFVPSGILQALHSQGRFATAYFDLEFERFPFCEDSFDTVLCCEVIEHMTVDPMALMSELNRVTKPGGTLVITTPNIVSWRGLLNMVAGRHPCSFNNFSAIDSDRHNREYTPDEIRRLLGNAGFDEVEVITFNLIGLEKGHWWLKWCIKPLGRFFALPPDDLRGDFILARGVKGTAVRDRLPDWLYGQFKSDRELLAQTGKYTEPV